MEEKRNGKATTSLVCGIVGLFFAGIILGIIALVQGNKALKTTKEGESDYKMAKAGKILGIIDIIGGAIAAAITIFGA
jgi:hypothetical protein